MDIKVIGAFRFALVDAVNMLARLGCKGYALPSIADLEAVALRLESPSPFDVVASILADNDYMGHKQMYMMAFGRVLDCEAFTGDVEADGEVYHYWEGLTAKLDDATDIDKDLYLAQVERLSGLVQENIRGMKASLTATFGGIDTKPEPQQKDLHYYCRKAIEKGYLIKTDTGYMKTKEITKAQLAYFLGHFLKPDGTFPDKEYCVMFGESRLSKAADQLSINKNGDGKPRGYEVIDELMK